MPLRNEADGKALCINLFTHTMLDPNVRGYEYGLLTVRTSIFCVAATFSSELLYPVYETPFYSMLLDHVDQECPRRRSEYVSHPQRYRFPTVSRLVETLAPQSVRPSTKIRPSISPSCPGKVLSPSSPPTSRSFLSMAATQKTSSSRLSKDRMPSSVS